MSAGGRRAATRLLAGAGACWGAALLLRPGAVVAALCPEYPPSRLPVVRLLGARLLVQHAAVLASPEQRTVGRAAAVDLLHAASMAPLLRSRRYGRAARISGGIAAASAVVGQVLAPRSERR